MICNGDYSPMIDYFANFYGMLNLKGYPSCMIGSKVMAVLASGWILQFGGVAPRRVFAQAGSSIFWSQAHKYYDF